MKKLSKDIKIKALLLTSLLLLSFSLWAKPVVVVNSVIGSVFGIYKGTTTKLKSGDHIPDLAEIMTVEGSQITFADYHDHKFHLAGSGHVKFTGNIVEVFSGYVWVQSYSISMDDFIIQTPNSTITYKGGEAIISYDKEKGRTQLYSFNDIFEIAHSKTKHFKESVDTNQFTFVDNKFENGAPRRPTDLGYDSFMKIKRLFTHVQPVEIKHPLLSKNEEILPRRKTSARIPASVGGKIKLKNNSKIIYLWDDPKDIQKQKDIILKDFYEKKLSKWSIRPKKKKFKPSYTKTSGVKIKIYGTSKKIAIVPAKAFSPKKEVYKKKSTYRLPASVQETTKGPFDSSLMNEFKKQMRHSNEENSLIRDLKNYKQDYKLDY